MAVELELSLAVPWRPLTVSVSTAHNMTTSYDNAANAFPDTSVVSIPVRILPVVVSWVERFMVNTVPA